MQQTEESCQVSPGTGTAPGCRERERIVRALSGRQHRPCLTSGAYNHAGIVADRQATRAGVSVPSK